MDKDVEMHPLVKLAKETIELYVRERRTPRPPQPLPPEMQRRAGTFVSIHEHGQLRGCIGTIEPTQDNVAEEVIQNAVNAATRDPRFPPVRPEELDDLEIKVDVLSEPEPVSGPEELDPKRYGLIVQSKRNPWKRGLLLPDLEGIDTVEKQLYWTRVHKAGIRDPEEPVQLYRFAVERYS
ncbi:MAG: AmmeMemoRadiSam system protein A [Anaerolineae bacterium]|nr:AmmeMemoRadiSam system protein A [Anaerolineae bacterium]